MDGMATRSDGQRRGLERTKEGENPGGPVLG
jgi:hypothetical protein